MLTDHNSITNVDGLNSVYGAADALNAFIVIKGEEVTDTFYDRAAHVEGLSGEADPANKDIHLNAFNLQRTVPPQGGKTAAETLQRNADAIRAAGGVSQVNHPNFGWALTVEDLKQLRNVKLFELFNGHRQVNNLGGGGQPGTEQMWDMVLSSGLVMYGTADDDAHQFQTLSTPNGVAQPARGWVFVRADRLTPEAIVAALDRGDFYASTGVTLADYQVTNTGMTVTVRPFGRSKYRVIFSGKDGRILKEVTTNPAVYEFQGDEMYVRAKVLDSNGYVAWTQPAMVGKAGSSGAR